MSSTVHLTVRFCIIISVVAVSRNLDSSYHASVNFVMAREKSTNLVKNKCMHNEESFSKRT